MILTTPNLEKNIKAIVGFFSRNKHNARTYELEALESVLNHIESSLKQHSKGLLATEMLSMLLMYHYSIYFKSVKEASFSLRNDIRGGYDLLLFKLYAEIVNQERMKIFDELKKEGASPERIEFCIQKLLKEYTIEQVKTSVQKTTHDIVTIVNNNKKDGIF